MKIENPVELRLSRRLQVHMVVRGALVGLAAGLVVGLYRVILAAAEAALRTVTGILGGSAAGMAAWALVVALVLCVVGLLLRWAPGTVGSGIPQVEAVALGRLELPWAQTLVAKLLEGGLTALAGLSLGREGPSVQLGGMCGKAVSRAVGATEGEGRLLVTCGAGAGMAAAFQAPLTGVMFAVEEIHHAFSSSLVIGAMSAAVTSVFLVGQLLGDDPLLPISFASDLPHVTYGLVALLGLLLGLLGALHNRGMFLGQRLFSKIRSHLPWSRLAVPFAAAWACAFFAPLLMDGGDAILTMLGDPARHPGVPGLLGLLLAKYLFTNASASSGAPGGTLYPLVVCGALAGALFGHGAVALLGFDEAYVANFMLLGVAGLFASAVQAPVTGCLLVFELTGSFSALLSLALVTLVSYVVANLTKTDGYYEHLLASLLERESRGGAQAPGRRSVVTVPYTVALGCPAEGCPLGRLDWPHGAVPVLVGRCGRRLVPEDDLVLEAADSVLFVVDSDVDCADALEGLFRPLGTDGGPSPGKG